MAEAIRGILLSATSKEPVMPETEALLVLAARSQHVAYLIRPALARGSIVLCDRFADSTFAYQGFGRGLSLPWLQNANRAATGGIIPHLTVLLDLPASIGLARRWRARGNQNRLDRESTAFHQRVRRGFLTLASQAPRRIKVVNANRPVAVVRAEIESLVLGWLRTHRRRAGAR
jgi:dTMP kinase